MLYLNKQNKSVLKLISLLALLPMFFGCNSVNEHKKLNEIIKKQDEIILSLKAEIKRKNNMIIACNTKDISTDSTLGVETIDTYNSGSNAGVTYYMNRNIEILNNRIHVMVDSLKLLFKEKANVKINPKTADQEEIVTNKLYRMNYEYIEIAQQKWEQYYNAMYKISEPIYFSAGSGYEHVCAAIKLQLLKNRIRDLNLIHH